MFVIGIVGIALAWVVYSLWQRRRLKVIFTAMQLLSETRQPYGDIARADAVAKGLPRVDEIPQGWSFVAGDPKAKGGDTYRAGDSLVCQFNADRTSYGLYVPTLPKHRSLQQIIANRPYSSHVEEDLTTRANYMKHIQNCTKAMSLPNGTDAFRGTYKWCFRDYVTQEEFFGMLACRSCLEKILFFPQQVGQITVNNDGSCTLDERSLLFGFVPLQILWHGRISHQGAIVWQSSSVRLGWRNFGKTFDKPPAAERLRQDKWYVRYPKASSLPSPSRSINRT